MLVLYATAAAIFWRLEASGLCRQQLCTFAVASLLVAGKVLDLPCPDHAHLYKVYTKVVNAISHCSHLTSENISPNQFTQVLLEYELKLMERIDFVCNKNLSLSHAYTKLAIMSSGNELHAAHSVLVCMFLTPICRYIDDVGDLGTLSLSITSSLKALDLNVSIQNDFARVGGLMNTFWTTYEEVLTQVLKKFVIISHSFPSSLFNYLTTAYWKYRTDLSVPCFLNIP